MSGGGKEGELSFNTKYGKVKMTAATSTERPSVPKSTEMRLGGISDDPFNTFGLASKKFVSTSLSRHESDKNAHGDIIKDLIRRIERIESAVGLKK